MAESKKLLQGKRCIVTGGSRGLGLAICTSFAAAGAKVAFTYSRNDDDAEDAREKIAAAGFEPLFFKGSVADSDTVNDVVSAVVKDWGGVDILVNNAGTTQILPIALLEEKDFDQVMAVNVKGPYLFSRACLKSMIRQKRGHILMVGTFASERMIEAPVHYAAAKSALRGMTDALAREVGRYGIQVNVLSPGLLDVGLARMLPQHRLEEYRSQCALGRLGTAAEVAKLATFLVSDDNTFMTAAKIAMDGGL